VLDADLLRAPLVLRNWRPGDSYCPRGRRISHKLKRLFWEAGVPARERASWPVLTSAERIVWSRKFGVAHEFAPSEGTRRGVLVSEDKL
jgi:tRNA(Ile)-lysidine synthase